MSSSVAQKTENLPETKNANFEIGNVPVFQG